ncbi:MAG: hypothetical protein JO337_06950 [Acidimicrobiales bacterium]|nr:hypothetical protein [Acidimicrobiales bacterium]
MNLDEAANELYRLDPAEFTTRRDAVARELRQAGDRELAGAVKALRRPSAGASVVNRLVWAQPDELGRLLQLGNEMRRAQASLAADELRALRRQRQQLVAALAQEALRLAVEAGHSVSAATEREVESTLDAAWADEDAGAAVGTGRLIRALRRQGMEPVDLDGAVAGSRDRMPDKEPVPQLNALPPGARREAEIAEAAARAALEGAEAELAGAEIGLRHAEDHDSQVRRQVQHLQAALEGALDEARQAGDRLREALQRRDSLLERSKRARLEHDSAAARLRDLDRS